jgi:hypothetical protein
MEPPRRVITGVLSRIPKSTSTCFNHFTYSAFSGQEFRTLKVRFRPGQIQRRLEFLHRLSPDYLEDALDYADLPECF